MYAHIVAGEAPQTGGARPWRSFDSAPFRKVLDSSRDVMERAVTPPVDMYETKDEVVP